VDQYRLGHFESSTDLSFGWRADPDELIDNVQRRSTASHGTSCVSGSGWVARFLLDDFRTVDGRSHVRDVGGQQLAANAGWSWHLLIAKLSRLKFSNNWLSLSKILVVEKMSEKYLNRIENILH
jgi:hypothetical protein